MAHPLFVFFGVLLTLNHAYFVLLVAADSSAPSPEPVNSTCPLRFGVLEELFAPDPPLYFVNIRLECYFILQAILVLRSDYLNRTGHFSLPSNSERPCWREYDSMVNKALGGFDTRSICDVDRDLMSVTCMNIKTRSQFENLVTKSKLPEIRDSCSRSLDDVSNCVSCKQNISHAFSPFFGEISFGNPFAANCSWYPSVYATACMSPYGTTDPATAECLFSMKLDYLEEFDKENKKWILFSVVGSLVGFLALLILAWTIWSRIKKQMRKKKTLKNCQEDSSGFTLMLDRDVNLPSTMMKFSYDEIKKATNYFSKDCVIGRGGYGNVYYGKLQDGSEVAVKRFKNCTTRGDKEFAHELEIIASIRHVNLIKLRGYCIATPPLEGHQRILLSEMAPNGSLSDRLFDPTKEKLPWPARQKIAIGVARGLAYLHFGAQPGIIHRDVKASNILLDDSFEPKLADFGLSKFTPEEFSHLSTRVAGTLGYVAPEYALYGRLTERTDVYGFGVVLLELLSGKRAVISMNDNRASLLTDWAWLLVREGRMLDVIDENMPQQGSQHVMEKYVVVAALASHPVLYARPTMDQIVTILESEDHIHTDGDLQFPFEKPEIEFHQNFSSSGSPSVLMDEQSRSDHPILDCINPPHSNLR